MLPLGSFGKNGLLVFSPSAVASLSFALHVFLALLAATTSIPSLTPLPLISVIAPSLTPITTSNGRTRPRSVSTQRQPRSSALVDSLAKADLLIAGSICDACGFQRNAAFGASNTRTAGPPQTGRSPSDTASACRWNCRSSRRPCT